MDKKIAELNISFIKVLIKYIDNKNMESLEALEIINKVSSIKKRE